eukprot:CAMPEP_0197835368 /NCGR_PEP_ID=MMETSP1437-20131217/25523_1 /TAXON_ID=49252 ORGANISM="Eucampia antarctica, Strain CCMP1452" /NCGR_SAMPLE_ID=MMETSP1437 /ASSEMBLY_ACC=CAM_ASM_001096 /LENGTH=336 /DNA_ID=CAMNT_0043440731 /DNA_START=93 /DNA_END=1103 /DNA_ORIENTATION=-
MSSGDYASRLSHYDNKGECGLPESVDSQRVLDRKMKKLINMVQQAQYIVILTGAGVSTTAGIPDFRGPKGIWTRELHQKKDKKNKNKKMGSNVLETEIPQKEQRSTSTSNKKKRKSPDEETKRQGRNIIMSFDDAKPTLTHRAITKMAECNYVKYCITQNVDGLHRRSGLPRSNHCSLHGCIFTEICGSCEKEHFRTFDVGGMSFQKTGRQCSDCKSDLRDTLLDWEDALPERDWERAQIECEISDLVICLGTSLRIEPVASLPSRAKQFVIVNLQKTPHDEDASLIIRDYVDIVMYKLMDALGLVDGDSVKSDKKRTSIIDSNSNSLAGSASVDL